ncbi:MAG: inositol monophosphatase [Alphaproteobacteria bacterium]|nr:inositol monophosphatase [Alphaproteobacteria bacterium]
MIDVARVTAIIREVAEAEILPRFKNLRRDQIREKKPNQLVTEADTEAERALAPRLRELADGVVVGEEGVESDPTVLSALERSGVVWVIDPVDGTANFANNNPRFAVIVALVVDGITQIGWIHDPVPNLTVVAERGQGAWRDGTRLKVAAEVPLAQMTGSVKKRGRVADQVLHVARRGSAAHDYLDLAAGRQHFVHFRRLMPWDHAAGVLIHQEAGGFARLLNGQDYRPVLNVEGQLLLTPGEKSWQDIAALMD